MTVRIALALLFVVPAAMAYPWSSTVDWWVLGVAVAVVVVLFAWWRGLFVTTIVGRRLAMWTRRNRADGARDSSEYTTVLLRIDSAVQTVLPVSLIAGYLDRYGIRCDKVRITSRDVAEARTTWIGLKLGASDNLAALRARSPQIPLRATAEVAARRLADHLRETGCNVAIVDSADAPAEASAKETWRGLCDASGFVAAYRVAVDDTLADTFAAVDALPSLETWTALEITGTAADSGVAVMCAIRFGDKPGARPPVAGLTSLGGRQRAALSALHPLSVDRLEADPVPLSVDLLDQLQWSAGRAVKVPV